MRGSPAEKIPREAPAPGTIVEIAPGILWTRFALPFALNHVNVFLLEDGDGWTIVDTGIDDEVTRQVWESVLAGPMAGWRIKRIFVTHHHPDHMGLAGWFANRFDVQIHMTEAEYLLAQHLNLNPQFVDAIGYRELYQKHGMDEELAAVAVSLGRRYKKIVCSLPWSYRQVTAGDTITIGGRRFAVLTGGGHSSDQAMLFCEDANLFIAADQIMLGISPNISVVPINPDGDPLGQYLRSLTAIRDRVPDGALVLPGHNHPFRTLHNRIAELMLHHQERCDLIEQACLREPQTATEILKILFPQSLDAHQTVFAFSETLAHVNMMVHQGRLAWKQDGGSLRAIKA